MRSSGVPGPRSTIPAVSRPPQPGDLIADRYELEEIVGTGGMSTVFCARDVQLDRRIAIKILHERFADDPEYLERFRREARAVARLSHPNIVTVIDRGVDDGRQYIVFEYVEGENLKELVQRTGRLPVRRALELALAVADGLSFAHEHGLVHRDVKPQNVLLSREGEVKVTDFGIARSLHVEHGVTQTGTVLGTSEYLAPEQASGKPVSPATDVYSLGVVLWELLAGDVPFEGENFVAVALRHLNEPPPDLRERRPDVSPRLGAAVERALAKDPARRFRSMAALARELRACLAEADGAAPAPAPVEDAELTLITPRPSVPARARRQRSRRRPLAFALLALVVAGAAFAAVVLLGGSSHHNGGPGGGGSPGSTVQLSGVGDAPAGNGDTHADTAGSATDGDPATYWYTQTYNSPQFGGLLPEGLGLVLDAGSSVTLARLTVTTPTPGFVAQIRVGDSPTGAFTPDSSTQTVSGTTATFTLEGAVLRRLDHAAAAGRPRRNLRSQGNQLVDELRAALVPLEREPDQPVERVRVAEARRLEQACPDARGREPGHRVELVEDDLAVALAHEEVDSREALALGRDERLDGAPLEQLDRLLRKARRRDDELHPAVVVFRRVVVPLVLERVDLAGQRRDRRRHAVAEHAYLDLRARDELLDEHLLVVPESELDRRLQLVLAVHLGDADGGAEPRRLDEDRVAERVLDRVAEPDGVVCRDGDAAVAHHLLEQVLVHRERGRGDAGADVGHVCQFEQPLHGSVLAERPVQDRQNDVHGADRLERPGLGRNGQRLRR